MTGHDDDAPQLELPGIESARASVRTAKQRAATTKPATPSTEPAETLPVARVLVDVPLAHLDKPFDYLVPRKLDGAVVPGSRVKVRFAGQDVDGFVVERTAESDHPGRLMPLRRAVSAEPVLSPAVARLSELVAARYAGTRSDVLRLAVPPRHATVEKQPSQAAPAGRPDPAAAGEAWAPYDPNLADDLAAGGTPRRVWSALPGADWPRLLAHAAAATLASGRGSLLCVPDHRDVARVDAALAAVLGAGRHVVLTADAGPSARYRAFLAVSRGAARVVVGTRAAAFAPVHELGLVALWDDGDDLYAEPRAPYPHTREVLLTRAHEEDCAALIGGFARTVEGEYLVRTGWATDLSATRTVIRAAAPQVSVTGATDRELERDPGARTARLPRTAYDAIRDGLEHGPVLLQVPRQGYAATLACDRCRAPARCRRCSGPLHQPRAAEPPACRWCGAQEPQWACAECGNRGLRAPVVGERRTAEELGRAFPNVPVRSSGGEHVIADVDARPSLVVSTPGAEPVAEGGYAAVVLLDTWLMLGRPDLRTAEESLRRWLNAAALARAGHARGRVVAVGDPAEPALQALVRWDPAGFAQREMAERQSAHLPPASRLATLVGAEADLDAAVEALSLPDGAEVLGPTPAGDDVRLVVRVPRAAGSALSRALVELQGVRDAKKLPALRVQVDPLALD